MELGAGFDHGDLVAVARVIEGRLAGHAEILSATDRRDPANHLPAAGRKPGVLADRHEIDEFYGPARRLKRRFEDE